VLAEEVEMDFIIPQNPRMGPVHIVPAIYDWVVWFLLALLMVGTYTIVRRRSRLRQRPGDLPHSAV
jgi:hypothetical protein